MTKIEQMALEKYPKIIKMGHVEKHDINLLTRRGFVRGYQQAEKDLALTWKDIELIWNIFDEIANDDSMEDLLKTISEEEYYQEVLRRFNKQKLT